jgi:hypothetical protein
MTPTTPARNDLFLTVPDTDVLAAWCRHASALPDDKVRARAVAWSAAMTIHAPSLATAVAAHALAREAFLAVSRGGEHDTVDFDSVALAAARLGVDDYTSVGEDGTGCVVIAGLAAARLAIRLDEPRLRLKARQFAMRLLTGLVTGAENQQWEDADPLRALASAMSDGTPWTVVDRLVIDELAARSASKPSVLRRTPNSRTINLLQGPITIEGDRDTRKVLERYRDALEKPMRLIVLKPKLIADTVRTLLNEMPNLAPATSAVLGDLRFASLLGAPARMRPTLIVGPAGVGKTRWVRRLSELLGLPTRTLPLAGTTDTRYLSGTARGWSSAQPSGIIEAIVETFAANPIVVGDELDKAGGSDRNGRVGHALLALLEKETATAWHDDCLRAAVDLSHVNWVMTANEVSGLSAPLRSRLRIIEVGPPEADAFDAVLITILDDIAAEFEVDRALLPDLPPAAIDALRRHWSMHRSPRRLRSAVLGLLDAVLADSVAVLH